MTEQPVSGSGILCAVAAALILLATSPAGAQPTTDPDWPCAQRLVPELAAATLWQGPPLPTTPPADDDAMSDLAHRLVDRDLPMDKANDLIAETAAALPAAERESKLGALFLKAVAIANDQRSGMIQGIRNFGKRQRALADRINGEGRQLRDLEAQGTDAAGEELPALRQQQQWDMRIFDERQRTVRLACDEPVLVEQRSFALGRAIANAMKGAGQ